MRPFSPFALIDAALQTGRSVRKGAPACSRSYSNKPSAADCDPKQSFTDYGQHRQAVSFDHLVGAGEKRGRASGRRGSEFTEGTTMNLATATVLAVLWAGPAVAADGLVGAYRDAGPRVDTPYNGRVPAWITRARVSRVGPKRYSIRMSTGRPSGCTGEVTATGTLTGTAMIATASDGADCKLAITFERSTGAGSSTL